MSAQSLDKDLEVAECLEIGCFLMTKGKHTRAAEYFDVGLQQEPNNINLLTNMGAVLKNTGHPEQGRDFLQRALVIDPTHAAAWTNLGVVFNDIERFDEGEFYLRIARELKPPFLCEVLMCLAMNSQLRGDFEETIKLYREAVDADPSNARARMSLGMLYMLTRKWATGLPLYEARLETQNIFPTTQIPVWGRLRSLFGKVLIVGEQGLGDTIQFARYASVLKACDLASKVYLFCADGMKDLIEKLFPEAFDGVFEKSGGIVPECDFQIPMMSVILLLHDLGADWVIPAGSEVKFATPRQNVGICWRGNPSHSHDKYRSFPMENFAQLDVVTKRRHNFSSLQYVMTVEELTNWDNLLPRASGSWTETATAMVELDLVITVDTAVAHLAGTLGVPTWLLLPALPDWRWGLTGETTPWYPSMRIFRQKKLGDWGPVFDEIGGLL